MTVAGAEWCHFDRWFARVADADFDGDLERLEGEMVGRLRSSLNGRSDAEAKLSHLTDLRHRLAAIGMGVGDLVGAEPPDKAVLAKARRKVGGQALEGRAMTPARSTLPASVSSAGPVTAAGRIPGMAGPRRVGGQSPAAGPAVEVFRAADQPGWHQEFLRRRCLGLTGVTLDEPSPSLRP